MNTIAKKINFRLEKLLRKEIVIPEMAEKRQEIEKYINSFKPNCFIETGTFFGDTVEYFKQKLDSIVSIELSEELAKKATERFKNDYNVKIVQGDSGIQLKEITANMKGTVLFWLDGHYSSEFFIKEQFIKTAKGDLNTPIEKEIEIILASTLLPVILIDDARLFTGTNDYPTLKTIKTKVNSSGRQFEIFVEKDIIHIIPSKI